MSKHSDWQKENMTQISVRLHNKNDRDIIDKIKSQGNSTNYIRNLVREDIEKNIKKDEKKSLHGASTMI